jgi:hypothetical protein
MRYPIDAPMFKEIIRTRRVMSEKNPDPDRIGIAGPFVPWIGKDILDSKPGIYIIGIATFGPYWEHRKRWTLEDARETSRDIVRDESMRVRPFWRFVNRLTDAAYGKPFLECTEKFAWSNQYKIGLFSRVDKDDINPEKCKGLGKIQFDLCERILQRELQLARRCVVIFLGDGSLIYPTVGKEDAWDRQRHKELGIWVLKNPGARGPVLYDYHPNHLFRRYSALVSRHVDVIASAIAKVTETAADKPRQG